MNRDLMLNSLNENKIWDVVIIGGGATGLGSAVDSSTRGYHTLLVEQADFAQGTSSRSTKLVHGGVRYLAQGDISLVLEALHERGLLRQNAPHLVKNQAFIIPNYEWWDGPFYTIGMKVYDMMAGKFGLGSSESISKEQTIEAIPNIQQEGLRGGVIYYDGQFDDSRLAINLAQTAYKNGAYVLNYMKVVKLKKNKNGFINGLSVMDQETGIEHQIKTRVVVNCTGVFVDDILKLDNKHAEKTTIQSRGVHLVLDKDFLQSDSAVMIPKTDDGRVLFAVPWHGKTLVGTTDTFVDSAELEPKATKEEVEFILNTASRYLTRKPKRSDVLSVFAGLRPLPNKKNEETKSISRNHKIVISPSRLVTVTGGKWTTYRKVAADAIDNAALIGGLEEKKCLTKSMPIHGYVKDFDKKDHLYVFGSDRLAIKKMMESTPEMAEKLDKALPYTKAEVVWGVREEMARKTEDVLARRLRALFLNARSAKKMAPKVAKILAKELSKNQDWIDKEIANFSTLANQYILK